MAGQRVCRTIDEKHAVGGAGRAFMDRAAAGGTRVSRGFFARIAVIAGLLLAAGLLCAGPSAANHQPAPAAPLARGDDGSAGPTINLQIVGGLAGVTQYTAYEQPFWEREITERSGGRITANIRPLDAGGLRAEETLQLMRLGVVPFGTASLSRVSSDDPELNAFDLPVLNPDMGTLRRTVGATRQHLADYLLQRYDIVLLAVYAYPAQVIFCTKPFSGLDDLVGRKVRTSSVGQAELMAGLGAVPVLLPFAEIVPALKSGVAECAITGTLSGYEIGLPGIATHVHSMAISWGLSFFGANRAAWNAVPADLQGVIREGVADLERRVWLQADSDTKRGLACNSGGATCGEIVGEMTLVPTSPKDAARRERLLERVVIPRWIMRCGPSCARAWNTYLAPVHGIHAETE